MLDLGADVSRNLENLDVRETKGGRRDWTYAGMAALSPKIIPLGALRRRLFFELKPKDFTITGRKVLRKEHQSGII